MRDLENTSLNRNERNAIEAAVEALKRQFPVEKIILFGSKARGDSDPYSDIDLLVVTSRPTHWKEERAIGDVLFDLGMEHDVIFSPLFASSEEWESGIFREFPVYREIIEEGTVLP